METNAPSAGMLVLSEVFYPGWKAWVDNQETPVLRANYLFRAIELPARAHRVRFKYEPMAFMVGVGLALFTMGTLVIIQIWRTQKNAPTR
jgi:uncharacterized membrane protein YfhO